MPSEQGPFADLVAPKGKYRVVGIDKFHLPGEDHWIDGDYDSADEALRVARQKSRREAGLSTHPGIATVYYVYDDRGRYLGGDIYTGE